MGKEGEGKGRWYSGGWGWGGGSGGWDQDRQVVARQSSNAINDSIHIHHMVTSHDTKPQHQTQTL